MKKNRGELSQYRTVSSQMPLYNPLQGKIVGLQRAPQLYQVPSAPGFSQLKESYGVVRQTMGLQSMPRLFTNAQPSLFAPANPLTRQQPNSIVSQTQYSAFLQAQAQQQRLAMMNTMLLNNNKCSIRFSISRNVCLK